MRKMREGKEVGESGNRARVCEEGRKKRVKDVKEGEQ